MELKDGCRPILATAQGLSLPQARCRAVKPWSSWRQCDILVKHHNTFSDIQIDQPTLSTPASWDRVQDEEAEAKPLHYASRQPGFEDDIVEPTKTHQTACNF